MWLDPDAGAVGPDDFEPPLEGTGVVLSAFQTGGLPARLFGVHRRQIAVDFRYRTKRAPLADALYLEVRRLLVRDDPMGWEMGGTPPTGVLIIFSQETRPFQLIAAPGETAGGYDYVSQIMFEIYVTA
jgi:hypothetical protein